MQKIKCSCCGGEKFLPVHGKLSSIYSAQPYDVVRCENCGNVITMPEVDEATLDRIYSTTYLYPVHKAVDGEKQYRARNLAKIIRRVASKSHRKVLEIGCMYGCLLKELQPYFETTGVELGDESVAECRALGLNVHNSSISDFLQGLGPEIRYDIIILSHVLEHLLEPDKYLRRFQEILNPGGLLVVAVPANDSINAKVFGRYWGWWQVPVHINHFNNRGMVCLAERAGFKVEKLLRHGGDSLMIVLNFINLLGVGESLGPMSATRKHLLSAFSVFLRYWYRIGDEELVAILRSEPSAGAA